MTKVIGPFEGKVMNTENYRLAEIWITEKGPAFEFSSGDFAKGTGVIPSSGIRVLNKLVEVGVLACYPHPRYKDQTLYQVADTVKTRPVPTVDGSKPVASEVVIPEGRMGVFSVALFATEDGKEKEIWFADDIRATSPREAVERVRNGLKAVVTQSWEF